MAAELKATNPAINIEILGVNRTNEADSNFIITALYSLPWLQDTMTNLVWAAWDVVYRDVRILDPQNRLVAIYNLTQYDLSNSTNRATLKQLFLDAARLVDTDGDGLADDWEILNFGNLSATPVGDPDADGRDNLSEYSFGTNPKDHNSKSSFHPVVVGTGSMRNFDVTFRRRAGSSLDYILETSSDLKQWNSASGTVNVLESFRNGFDGTGTGQTTCRLVSPVQGEPRAFLRVRAVPRIQP